MKDDEMLLALLDGSLPEEQEEQLVREMESDPQLRERLAQLSGESLLKEDLSAGMPEALPVDAEMMRAAVKAVSVARGTSSPGPVVDLEMPGSLGGFTVLERIAQGGMATVYRAQDESLGREVALKVLYSSSAAPLMTERFFREARTMAEINHPHVLPIHQVVGEGGRVCMVMHFAQGGSVQDRLDALGGKPLPTEELVRLGVAVADALVAVHARGLVHRDVKPSNILLGKGEDEIWLADFGLVRDGQQLSLTRSHMFVGTPEFMSPEQAAGVEVDYRSDLYSFGAVLYTMATGRVPFSETDFDELRRLVREERPLPLSVCAPELPVWLRNLIESLLVKDREHRLENAATLLQTLKTSTDRGSAPSRWLWGRKARRQWLLKKVGRAVAGLLAGIMAVLVGTEQTGRTELVNQYLAAHGGQPFWIAGDWGTYANLESAVNAAQLRGGAVEIAIHSNATLRFGHLSITEPLTLRATRGRRPTLSAEEKGVLPLDRGHIELRAPLTLKNLTIHQRAEHFYLRPMFVVQNTELSLQHCRLVRSSRPYSAERSIEWGVISGVGSCRITLQNTECVAFGSPAIMLKGNGVRADSKPEVKLRNSRIFGRFLSLRGQAVDGHLEADRSVLSSIGLIEHYAPDSRLRATWKSCQLRTIRYFVRTPDMHGENGQPWLQWWGENNLISNMGPYIQMDNGDLETFEDWQGYVIEGGGQCVDSLVVPTKKSDLVQINDARIFAGESYVVEDPRLVYGHQAPELVPLREIGPPVRVSR
ncbi:hypothetical protein FEM03_23120 [Phragmitibacter flavus]|uniref:Protein kinase domain-containing protein n=1 Tax=Phragmitibacter flavus TaxID=2576071 RepID=A0A5R8K7T2_9BACT|nr:serine/threonine-protein kinase [Phragmitibacter flavus]TLD68396.1 hypothetical protein FEM03_23120 [Phragmitibacter flavus]